MTNLPTTLAIGLVVCATACGDDGQAAKTGGPADAAAGTGGQHSGGNGGQGTGGTAGQTNGGNGGGGGSGGVNLDAGLSADAEGGEAATEGGAPDGCTAIHIDKLQFDPANSSNVASLFRGPLTVQLGDPGVVDGVILSVVSLDGSALQKTGAFQLGMGVEANYSTCEHCVVVVQDGTSTTTKKRFFPVSGTMNIDPSTPPAQGATKGLKGSLVDVKLIEVTIGPAPTYRSTPVSGGACIYLADDAIATQ
jgi:hypothetical protein